MTNDLISQGALINAKPEFMNEKVVRDTKHRTSKDRIYAKAWNTCNHYWLNTIKNAPTVELTETEVQEVLNKRCMTAVANEYLVALHGKRPQGEWFLLSEKQPPKSGYYITSTINNEVFCDYWSVDHFDRTETVIAWQPLPEPYKKGGVLSGRRCGMTRLIDSEALKKEFKEAYAGITFSLIECNDLIDNAPTVEVLFIVSTIGTRIKKLLLERNLSEKELAKALNVSVQSVTAWVNDKSKPLRKKNEIASFLGVSVDYLMWGKEE